MGKTLQITLVLLLISRCLAVPLRPRRQVQDLQLLHEEYDGDDYSSDNSGGHIVDDGTSHLTPLDEIGTDHLHGHVEYVDNYPGNRSGSNDHIGSSDNIGGDRNMPNIDLESDQSSSNVEPDIDHGNFNDNIPDLNSDSDHSNVQVQGRLPISGDDVQNSSSARQGHVEAIDSTRTDRDDHYVINAVGRAVHNVNVSTTEEYHYRHDPLTGDQYNTNTSESHQIHHGFLMGGDIMVNTSEENKAHHGFLMGGDVQNLDNGHNLNTLTTRIPTSPQSVIPSSTTTTPESFITVKLSNMSSHELTESSSPEHSHNNDIVIDRTDQSGGRRGNPNQDSLDGHEHSYDADKDSTTEEPQTSGGHVATLPGEQTIHEHVHEHEEHLHGETEGNGQGIDIPIDKGEHQHNDNNEENNEPGRTRQTSNPVVRTPQRPENIPATETTTPNLIILPTPANLEPEERKSSTNIQEPHSTVTVHGGQTEHTEQVTEGHFNHGEPGESGIHRNNQEGNYSEETHIPTSEGHIEFVTELPEIHGDNELKPNKHLPKYSVGKSEDMTSLVSPTSVTLNLEKSNFISTETEEYFSESFDRSSITKTEQTDFEHYSTVKNLDMTSTEIKQTCLQSENQICSTLTTGQQILPSQSFLHEQNTDFSEKTTQNVLETTPVLNFDTSLTRLLQDISLYTHSTSPDQNNIQQSSISPSKTVDENMQIQNTESSIVIPAASIAPTKYINNPSSSSSSLFPNSDITSYVASILTFTPLKASESSTSSESQYKDNVLHTSQDYASAHTNLHSLPVHTSTDHALKASAEYSNTNNDLQTLDTSRRTLHSSMDYSLPSSSSTTTTTTTNQWLMQSSQEQTSKFLPTVTVVQQTTPTSVTFPMLTSNPSTKKKVEHSTTPTILTTHSTQKKPHSDKEPEKPENEGSSSSASTTTTTTTTTTSHIISSSLPTSTMRPATTQRLETSTQPSVYIEIQLRMDWRDFCSSKIEFISGIKDIILSEKGYIVDNEQFVLSTEDCTSANNLLLEGEHIQVITIQMYIVDNDGKLDILLTTETSTFILKGFQQSNFLKDKIVSVHTVNRKPPELLPEARPERKTEPPNVTMVIVLASMGGVCCVALVILQVLIHRRIRTKRKQRQFIGHRASLQSMDHVALGVIPKSRPNSGYWNPALDDTLEVPEPDEHSHVLSFSGLVNFCMDTKAIYSEFQAIPFDEVDSTSIPIGEDDKNRFANVLPHKHNRVYLEKSQENKSGYINANYVDGYMGEKRVYIATQSPLVNTVDDFWRMIWEQQTRTILMLNPMTSHGKPKQSTCYWPDNLETDNQREFEDYIVTLKKRDVQQDYVDCTLEIIDIEKNLKREIHHFWLTCWSDTGPPEPLTFVKFVLDTRPHYENNGSPVVVHCGPGTGRTGTFIAVDICMRMFEDRRRVDIQSCVHKMRSERAGAVQTKEQYLLIYQALNEYAVILSSPSISTRSSVITLHAML